MNRNICHRFEPSDRGLPYYPAMDWFLIISAAMLMIGGIAGAILPLVPGPPMCFAALVILHLSERVEFSTPFLLVCALVTVVVMVLDFVVPGWGTKKLGGSDAGIRGATVGLIIGLFVFPPFGIILGPPVGAMSAELLIHRDSPGLALRSGFGSLLGFLAGTGLKLAAALFMGSYFVMALVDTI